MPARLGAVGAAGGAAGSAAAALGGNEAGAAIGMVAGPVGPAVWLERFSEPWSAVLLIVPLAPPPVYGENSRSYADWPSLEFSIFRDAQLGRLKWRHRKKRGPHGLPPIRPADHNQLIIGVGNG